MAKTAAERQKDYRDKQRNEQHAMATAAGVTVPVLDDGVERNAPVTEIVTESPKSVTPVTQNVTGELGQSVTRVTAEPEKLNWGPWLNSDELSKAGLKANRVSIPGDWDYKETA